jgi:hypothetical protein
MNLFIMVGEFSICHLDPEEREPEWLFGSGFRSITHSDSELSIICRSNQVPEEIEHEGDWRGIEVEGPLAFDQIGVLSGLLDSLAEAQVPVFVTSTFQTDYIFIQEHHLSKAVQALESAGHHVLATSSMV